jgi:hypothetical protein
VLKRKSLMKASNISWQAMVGYSNILYACDIHVSRP